MDWISHISLELGCDYDLPTDGDAVTNLISLFTGCYCEFRNKAWPFHNVLWGDCHKRFPLVYVRVKYYSVHNHSDNPDLVVKLDTLRPQLYAHQFVSEQVRCTLILGHQLGKRISIESDLVEAAHTFLSVEDCPHENYGCHRSSHRINDVLYTCPRRALFLEIINIHNDRKIPTLFCLSRTVFLGTVDSIADAYRLSGYPANVVDFSFDINTIGLFHCIFSKIIRDDDDCVFHDLEYFNPLSDKFPICHCKEGCMMTKKFCFKDTTPIMWPCDMISLVEQDHGLASRLFGNVSAILYYIKHGEINGAFGELDFLLALSDKFNLYYCMPSSHCDRTYLDWVNQIGLATVV